MTEQTPIINTHGNNESVNPNLLIEQLSDAIWKLNDSWTEFAKTTLGMPVVKIVDEIGLQLTLTRGHNSVKDYLRYLSNARKGLVPADYYLQRAFKRGIIAQDDAEQFRAQLLQLAHWIDHQLQTVVKEANKKAAEQKQKQKAKAEQTRSSIEFEAEGSTAH